MVIAGGGGRGVGEWSKVIKSLHWAKWSRFSIVPPGRDGTLFRCKIIPFKFSGCDLLPR